MNIKKIIVLNVLLMPFFSFTMFECFGREIDMIHKRFEIAFEEMSHHACSTKLEMSDYNFEVKEEDNSIIITSLLAKNIKPEDISVEIKDDVLEIFIQSRDTLTIKISGQSMHIVTELGMDREEKDEHGNVYLVASGGARMSRMQSLPNPIDLSKSPRADLTNGVLTVTLVKKGSQKIHVTTSETEKPTEKPDEQEVAESTDIENLK